MGIQLLFCVETDDDSKTDWVYIKETLDHYYRLNNEVSLKPVYMSGKGNYKKGSTIREIRKRTNGFRGNGKTVVIYCIDTDDIFADPDRVKEFEEIQNYCGDRKYEFSWFCRDVEEVYWGQQVPASEKVQRSKQFRKVGRIENIPEETLRADKPNRRKSNILGVVDKYLERKK